MISTLIKLAVDVYNNSFIKTLQSWSQASRSLAEQGAENLIAQFTDHGLDCTFMRRKLAVEKYGDVMRNAGDREARGETKGN